MRLHRWLWVVLLVVAGCKRSDVLALGPTRTLDRRDSQGTDSMVVKGKCESLWDYKMASPDGRQSACVAMGIADYCGSGDSNTLNGTEIEFFDQLPSLDGVGINDLNPSTLTSTPPFYFEAAWVPGKRRCRGRDYGHPICLSKKRWNTLPLNGPCTINLPDPRVGDSGRYCEDLKGDGGMEIDINTLELPPQQVSLNRLKDRGALIFSYSAINELALRQWTNGLLFYASSDGQDPYPRLPRRYTLPGPVSEPFHPYYRPSRPNESLEGVLFSQDFYDRLPGKRLPLSQQDLVKLVTYQVPSANGMGFITTTQPLNYQKVRDEGYIFRADPSDMTWMPPGFRGTPRPLYRYRRAALTIDTYLTSTIDPQMALQLGFRPDRRDTNGTPIPEGYVLRSP